jgi:hypothetical protein
MITNEVVRDALAKLEEDGGTLTPQSVVEAAKSPRHPLHACFEWDDSVAAHTWRIEQARGLIRSVKLVITVDRVEFSTVHYVRDPRVPSEDQGYVGIPNAQGDADLAQQIIRQEFSRADAALRRAQDVAKALGVERVLDKARKRLARSVGEFEREVGQQARA